MSPPDSSDGSVTTPVANSADDLAESLGEALAGMNMGAANSSGASSFVPSPPPAPAPFSLAPGSSDDGWGSYSDAAQAAFPGSGQRDGPASGGDIELFLSQSPSQTLGHDVFKFSHTNLPAIGDVTGSGDEGDPSAGGYRLASQSLGGPGHLNGGVGASKGPNNNSNYGNIMPAQQENGNPRRRTESPSTGTTSSSRSVSPYATSSDLGSRGNIGAFRYDGHAAPTDDRGYANGNNNNNMPHGQGSHPNLPTMDSGHRSPFNKDRNNQNRTASPYDQGGSGGGYDRSTAFVPGQGQMPAAQQQQHANGNGNAAAAAPGQPQVLYMAVPSPDGRGQVLQPVQMVQLPGDKSYSYVMPGAAGGGGAVAPQQVMGVDGSHAQPMMVLPPLPNQHQNQTSDYGGSLGGGGAGNNNEPRSRGSNYAAVDNNSNNVNNQSNNNNNRQYDVATTGRDDYKTPGMPRVASAGGLYPQTADAAGSPYATMPQQRPPLDALLGQVRRLSRDQVGCRLVQQALDEEGPMAATLILNEGLPFWGEAMVDPFGNYLFQKILEKITPEERVMLLKSVSPRIVNASLNLHGTRSVQKVVELCAQDEQLSNKDPTEETASDILTKALAPAAARLCIDSHGNHVIQRILLKLGHKHSKFVFDAVAESVGDVARHRHGCCVIQRCLDSPRTEARSNLVDRIVKKSLELMQDAYGNYVVQYVLDVCADDHVQAVCESVVGRVNLLAIQKFSSNVMEKCLERCSDRVKELYVQEMSEPDRIRELMMDPFGNYVVQRALSVSSHVQAVRLVEAMRPHLISTQTTGPNGQRSGGVRNTAGGRRIIAKICRRFPNFTLNEVGSQDELYGQNKGVPRHQQQAPVVAAAYAPMGGQQQQMPLYGMDPHMSHGQMAMPMQQQQQQHNQQQQQHHHQQHQQHNQQQQQQQQSYYNVGATPYYDYTNGGLSGYPGM
jgi:hypothetical protein